MCLRSGLCANGFDSSSFTARAIRSSIFVVPDRPTDDTFGRGANRVLLDLLNEMFEVDTVLVFKSGSRKHVIRFQTTPSLSVSLLRPGRDVSAGNGVWISRWISELRANILYVPVVRAFNNRINLAKPRPRLRRSLPDECRHSAARRLRALVVYVRVRVCVCVIISNFNKIGFA